MAHFDHRLRTDDAGALDHVAQLADVAGPAIGLERGYRTVTEAACRAPVALHEERQEALGQGQHRSEEHTSELQSRENLVCRLLLEKKKATRKQRGPTASPLEQTRTQLNSR